MHADGGTTRRSVWATGIGDVHAGSADANSEGEAVSSTLTRSLLTVERPSDESASPSMLERRHQSVACAALTRAADWSPSLLVDRRPAG